MAEISFLCTLSRFRAGRPAGDALAGWRTAPLRLNGPQWIIRDVLGLAGVATSWDDGDGSSLIGCEHGLRVTHGEYRRNSR
jgi:hypothetical protein